MLYSPECVRFFSLRAMLGPLVIMLSLLQARVALGDGRAAREPRLRHRLTVEAIPGTGWASYSGFAEDRPADEYEESAHVIGLGIGWEYLPLKYLGVGLAFGLRVPLGLDDHWLNDWLSFAPSLPSTLLFLGSLRGILPLVDDRLELFVLTRLGGALFIARETFFGWHSSLGWSVDAAGGIGWAFGRRRRWLASARFGYRFSASSKMDNPAAWEGTFGASRAF